MTGGRLREDNTPGEQAPSQMPAVPAGQSGPRRQPLWLTWLARMLLLATLPVVAVAILFSNTQMAALRRAWPWLSQTISRVERLWPAVDMVHVVMFGGLGLLLVLAFPAVRLRVLYLALAALAVLSEFVQIWIPGRTASFGEVLLDLVAGGLGMGAAWLFVVTLGWRRATIP